MFLSPPSSSAVGFMDSNSPVAAEKLADRPEGRGRQHVGFGHISGPKSEDFQPTCPINEYRLTAPVAGAVCRAGTPRRAGRGMCAFVERTGCERGICRSCRWCDSVEMRRPSYPIDEGWSRSVYPGPRGYVVTDGDGVWTSGVKRRLRARASPVLKDAFGSHGHASQDPEAK